MIPSLRFEDTPGGEWDKARQLRRPDRVESMKNLDLDATRIESDLL
jgi:hypothetical protein